VSVKSDKNSTWTLPISPDEANVCQRLADPSPIVILQELLPDKKGSFANLDQELRDSNCFQPQYGVDRR
jgi:hypothetical protein